MTLFEEKLSGLLIKNITETYLEKGWTTTLARDTKLRTFAKFQKL